MKRACLAALVLAAPPAAAYDLMGVSWSGDEIPVPYVVNATLSDDLTDAESLEGIQMGFNAWNVLPCSSMRWQYAGRTQNRGWGVDDGENVVTFLNDFWDDSGDTLAITMTMWGGWGDAMSDADIKFNGVWHRWAQFDGAPAGGADATDLASVTTHEVGHALGLNHSGVPDATMWPSVGPGDPNPRTLSADDIAGACALYATGQPAPRPEDLPPPSPGTEPDEPSPPAPGPAPDPGLFGEDCTSAECSPELMCITDRSGATFCSRACSDDAECGEGYWCAPLAGGQSACARGRDDRPGLAGAGETCGRSNGCAAGLRCIADAGENYCVQDCGADGLCSEGFACAALASGRQVCIRAENGLPRTGEACASDGRCAVGLICLADAGRRYCTRTCAGDDCGPGAACVAIDPDGMACRLLTPGTETAPEAPVVPEGAPPTLGSPCVFAPGRPACEVGLACVDTVVLDGTLVEPGYCTVACDAAHCCPEGLGCTLDIGGHGRCRLQVADEAGLECAPEAAGADDDSPRPEGVKDRGSDTFGCASTPLPLFLLLGLGFGRRRKAVPSSGPMSGGRTLSLLLVVALTACAGGLQEDAGDAVATSTPPPPPWLAETDAGTGVGGPPAPRSEALEPALAPDAQAADAPLPDAEAPTSPAPAPESEAPAPATEAPAPATEAPAPATEAPAPATEAPAPATEAPAAAAESGDALPADIVVPDAGDATPPADATPDVLPDVSPDANPPPAPTDACAAEPTRCDICTCRLCGERWAMCFADAGCAAIMECSQRTGCFGDACVGPCGLEIALAGRLAVARAIEVAECSVVRCGRTLDTCAAADPGPPAR